MSGHARARADRIREELSIVQVLEDYGYYVRFTGGDREQQFPCNLHGDGQDQKASARVYPDSESWYCFGCGLSRDAIATVQDVEGVGFWDAIKILEKKYHLPPMKWEEGPREDPISDQVSSRLLRNRTFEEDQNRISDMLYSATRDRSLPLGALLPFWETFDQVVYWVKQSWTETQGRKALARIRQRFLQAWEEANK